MRQSLSDRPYIETLDGVEYEKVSPNFRHGLVQLSVLRLFNALARDFGVAIPDVHARVGNADGSDSLLVPDVAFYRESKVLSMRGEDRLMPPCAPEIAVEIRSPDDRRGLRDAKIAKYLATGAVLVLDIDPVVRRIAAHAGGRVREFTQRGRFEHEATPWLIFDIAEVFSDLDRFGL